jgi:hypothetical protein
MRALIKLILNDNLSRIKLMKDSTIRALYRHIYSKIWLKTSTRADHLFFLDYAPSIELKKLVLVKDLDLDILFKLLNKKINYKGNPALAHGRLPLELIESHFKSAEEFDHQCLARNPALPEDKMEFYFNKYPVSLALNRALTKEQCERLLATEDVSVLTNLLRNPAMPVDVIQKQLKTISTKYAQDLVYNWGLTSEMLDYFMFGNNNILSGLENFYVLIKVCLKI